MSRIEELLKYSNLEGEGIEIAPYFNPTVPKCSGRSVRIFDVLNTEELRALAKEDTLIPDERIDEIEPVDFVGDACRIGEVLSAQGQTNSFHYIVSSHNFEHLSNPILFLRGCEEALVEGGVVSMAIPDYRACFDNFRFPTRLSDWLQAFHTDRRMPDPATIFDDFSNKSLYMRDGKGFPGCHLELEDPKTSSLWVM